MLVLHVHWQPPHRPDETGGMLFWAESPFRSETGFWRGRLPKRFPVRDHPFFFPGEALRDRIGAGTPLGSATITDLLLNLPTTRTGPLASPELSHLWELDTETEPFLAPWKVQALRLPPDRAFGVLTNLPERSPAFVLGQDARFWRVVSNLVLEVLASQRLVPTLTTTKAPAEAAAAEPPPTQNGRNGGRRGSGYSASHDHDFLFQARWQPVLDGPNDAMRLAQLARAMPPLCQAENGLSARLTQPRNLIDTYLNDTCDALMRSWARSKLPRLPDFVIGPFQTWLTALFSEDPNVRASYAQLQAFNSSLRAWTRNLQAAGDANFRIAFRLEAPEQQTDPDEPAWKFDYFIQARDDPSLLVPAEEVWRTSGGVFKSLGRRFAQPQEKLLAGLGYAARIFPPMLSSLQTSHPSGTRLDSRTAYRFLREDLPLLEQAGFGLLVPPWWNQKGARLGVRLRLQPAAGQKIEPSGKLSLGQLVTYHWDLALGETVLTRQEFESLAAMKVPLVQVRGQWVQLDTEQVEAAIRFWENQQQTGELTLLQAAQLGLGGQNTGTDLPVTEVTAEGWVADWLDRLGHPESMVELPQPQGLQGQLRPYQRYGYSWLAFFRRWGLGACLADDMGLGKTIQALSLLLHEKESMGRLPGPVLLVCPTSVVTNWEHEVRRFAPGLTTLMHQGPTRLRNSEFEKSAKSADMVLTSYAVARQDAETMQKVKWYGVILDEAQNIKNPSAKTTQAVRALRTEFRMALTGTPVENRLTELWSIMHFLNPGYLGSQEKFRSEFSIPIERFGDPDATHRLKQLVGPFILRRLKTDPRVIQDLPEKIEMKEYCHLTEEQATLYEATVQQTMARVAESEGLARRGLVLALLMQLKQICNHPAQFMHAANTESLDNIELAGRSGKLGRLTQMLEEVLAENDRALVFTQFAEMGHILATYLPQALGASVQYLHGGTPFRMREQMVRRFQEDAYGPSIFILSLKAGGIGLNLTAANHVFHFDRWWNPAVEDQATDRSYRIGQKRNVQVHKFVTSGTLEERIDDLIESKKNLSEAIIGGSEDEWLTELSTEELSDLVRLRR